MASEAESHIHDAKIREWANKIVLEYSLLEPCYVELVKDLQVAKITELVTKWLFDNEEFKRSFLASKTSFLIAFMDLTTEWMNMTSKYEVR